MVINMNKNLTTNNQKTVLITGVASGIGEAVKSKFLSDGYNVIGIDIKEVEEVENLISFGADITSSEDLKEIKNYCIEHNILLEGIINIAGVHKMASFVETGFSDIKKLIDINLLGTMLVNHTFHSLLKAKGRIVIVTSEVASMDPMPFNGLYNVSKTALDSYAQGLRQELNLIDQKVITIKPGSIKTPLSKGSLDDTEKLASDTKLYAKQAGKFLKLTKKFMGKTISPDKVATLIFKAYHKKKPKLIYHINRNFYLTLLNILPKRLQCFIIKALLK